MITGKKYIKKKLYRFLLITAGVLAIEYLLIFVFSPNQAIHMLLQIIIGVFYISTLLETSYRVWIVFDLYQTVNGVETEEI